MKTILSIISIIFSIYGFSQSADGPYGSLQLSRNGIIKAAGGDSLYYDTLGLVVKNKVDIRGRLLLNQSTTLNNVFINGGNPTATQGGGIVIGTGSGLNLDFSDASIFIGNYIAPNFRGRLGAYSNFGMGGSIFEYMSDTAEANWAFGHRSQRLNRSNYYVGSMGISSAEGCISCKYSLAYGVDAMLESIDVTESSVFGHEALSALRHGTGHVAINRNALHVLRVGDSDIAIGKAAFSDLDSGSYNIRIGPDVIGVGMTAGHRNIFIGDQNAKGTGDDNIGIGSKAGFSKTTGSRNLLLGTSANAGAGTNSGTVVIGNYVYAPAGNARLNIGGVLFGTGLHNSTSESNTFETGGRICIGCTTPDATFQVNGTLKFVTGNQASGKVLTSDSNGAADWAVPIAPQTSGVFTPLLYNSTNVSASSVVADKTYWTRIGDYYEVWGEVTIDPISTATLTELGMALNITTSITTAEILAGTASCGVNTVKIVGDVANGRAMFSFTPTDVTSRKYSFYFKFK